MPKHYDKKDNMSVSKEKAKKILKDGQVHGRELSKEQNRFFGAIAGGESKKK